MPAPDYITDGDVVFGTQDVTINGRTYVAEAINISRLLEATRYPSETGQATKQSFVAAVMGGSAVLVFSDSAQPAPELGRRVALTPRGAGAAPLPFWVTAVTEIFTQDGETKCAIELTQKLDENPIPVPIWDGDFTQATPVGPMRIEHDKVAQALFYRQTWAIAAPYWQPTPWGDPCPANAFALLIDETATEPFGPNIVAWDKVWVAGPVNRDEPVWVNKTYKTLVKQWDAAHNLINAQVFARNQVIKGTQQFRYSRDPAAFTVPGVPDVAVNAVGAFTWVQAYNGFPVNLAYGTGPDENNYVHFITGSLARWRGDIWEFRLIYA